MSVFASRNTAAPKANTAAKKTEERAPSEYWLNIGYSQQYTDAEGKEAVAFISLNRGIALDDIEQLDESRSGMMGAMNQASNVFLADIREEAAKLEPGEAIVLNPGAFPEVQLRRVRDKSVPSISRENNPFLRK